MSTGDLKNNVKQLVNELKTVKYGKSLDTDQIVSGSPKAYLPIYNFLFTGYNAKFNGDIVNSNNELYGKSDMRFMEAVYKVLRDMFGYKSKISRDQFFAPGFSEHKVIMARDVVRLVRSRYSPPKSARSHVTSASSVKVKTDKVPQEPTEIPQQKVSGKQSIPPTVAAGAIVLPTRLTTSSIGYKIPKSSQGLPGPKHNQERPLFGETVPPAPAVSSSSVSANRRRSTEHAQSAPTGHVEPRVIKAMGNPTIDYFNPLPVHSGLPKVDSTRGAAPLPDTEEIETIVRRKIVDLVSPAMVKLNERVGILEISLEDLEEKEKQPVRSEPAPSPALINGLTQQMNDVVFKLQTLTSRITLLENRVTMVEAQLSDEESHRMTLFASQSYTKSKKSSAGITQDAGEMKQSLPTKTTRSSSENSYKPVGRTPTLEKVQIDRPWKSGDIGVFPSGERSGEIETHSRSDHKRLGESCKDGNRASQDDHQKGEIDAVRVEPNPGVSVKSPALAFMKTLVHPEDCNSLLTTSGTEPPEDLTATETEDTTQQNENGFEPSQPQPPAAPSSSSSSPEATTTDGGAHNQQHLRSGQKRDKDSSTSPPAQQQQPQRSKPSKSGLTGTRPPFSEDFSPVRPISDFSFLGRSQDESASMVFPSAAGYMADDSSLADRRSSTPTGQSQGLDTSTLDRISRINQMMMATDQLLH